MAQNGKTDFQDVLQRLAGHFGWDSSQIEEEEAVFDFKVESGNEKTLYLYLNEGSVEFNVPSDYGFDDAEDAPHEVSTILLRRNANVEVGAWILEDEDDGEWVYTLVWDADLETLASLGYEEIETIIHAMLEEVDEFDRLLGDDEEEE
jgi:hypothetical protein